MILCQLLWRHLNYFQYPSLIFLSSYQRATPKFGPRKESGRIWCCLPSFPFPISWEGVDCFWNSMVCFVSTHCIWNSFANLDWSILFPIFIISDLIRHSTLLSTYSLEHEDSTFYLSIASQKDLENILQTLELYLPQILRFGFLLPFLASSVVAHLLDTAPYYCFFIDHKGTKQIDDLPKGKKTKWFCSGTFWQWEKEDSRRPERKDS